MFYLERVIKNRYIDSIDFNLSRYIYADGYNDIETIAVTSSGYCTSTAGNPKHKNANGGTTLTVAPYFANYAPDSVH